MTFTRVKEIFVEAVAEPAEGRSAVISRACAGDSSLRAQVEMLLRHHDEAGQFLGTPNPEEETIYLRSKQTDPGSSGEGETSGVMIGRYELVKKIGEGGFGTVWMAQQREPVTRRVALKIVKLGMDTRQLIARFEAERQALAMMDHPNIARVFDAGATETGRPYFVMELCAGDPIAAYCDDHNLSIPQRLQLFVQVCAGVQYAHQKGIIHRDIKPSNILVSTQDGRPSAKVIDFGIAKATGARLTEKTLFTEHGAMIGTLEYMSPEQAEGSLDIDTRTDVYSLGVLLYELLTGSTPFNAKHLRGASHAEIQRIICEVEPPTPSTRLSQSQETLHQVATHRQAVPRRLGTIVRGELDWIVMKALEKDRARRYDTASALALEIERYLNHEPVLAGPPSSTYRMRKFIRRNKLPVGAAAGIVLALATGLVVSDLQRRRAVRAEQLAATRLTETDIARRQALKARDQAIDARDESDQVIQFLKEMLAAADPSHQGKDVTVREVLDRSAETIGEKFANRPLVEARLRDTIGWTYKELGFLKAAQRHLDASAAIYTRELGPSDLLTLSARGNLASVLVDQGAFEASEASLRTTVQAHRQILGPEHQDTLKLMVCLGNAISFQGRNAEAEPIFREVLKIQTRVWGEQHPELFPAMLNLATCLHGQGRYAEAEAINRKVMNTALRVLGQEHSHTLAGMDGLCGDLHRQEHFAEAEELTRGLLIVKRRVLGEEHPSTLMSISNLAALVHDQRRYAEGEVLARQALELYRRVMGDEHPNTLSTMGTLANCLSAQGNFSESEELIRQSLAIQQRVLGDEHPGVLIAMHNLAGTLASQGKLDEAEALMRKTLELQRRVLGNAHPFVGEGLSHLADTLIRRGALQEAEILCRELVEFWDRTLPPDHWKRHKAAMLLGHTLARLGRFSEAESLLLRSNEGLRADSNASPRTRILVTSYLLQLYESWGAAEPGKGYDLKADEWRKKLEEQNTETQESQKPGSQALMD